MTHKLEFRNVVGILHGFSVADIQRWCGVSRATAYRIKNGDTKPSPAAVRLLTLHAQNRVLGDEWAGWRISGDMLVDPDGNCLTVRQILQYVLVYQLAQFHEKEALAELQREAPSHRETAPLLDFRRKRAT